MTHDSNAQHGDKPRPEAWKGLVYGGRFMDRILPAPIHDKLTDDTWGAEAVRPRDIHNGIEDPNWSYWGGRPILGPDGKYNLIVNDWHGRVAHHMRSKDGVHWKENPGEAYTIDFDGYEDGTNVGWYKYERPKVLQDQYGRATYLYLAVIDVPKKEDKGNDNHSSKNIALPLVVGRRLKIIDTDRITADTQTIRLQILAERDFDPHKDVAVDSLRFGAPEKVDFGGGGKAIKSETSGSDLIVTFDASGHGVTDSNFAAKLIGKTAKGKLLFGYSRLPGVDYSPFVIPR